MVDKFSAMHHVRLQPGTSFLSPPQAPGRVKLTSPALSVMTDFNYVRPVTVDPATPIDIALEHMKKSGVRLLLVTDERRHVLGIVSSYDIQGEKPIQIVNESRVPRGTINVAQIMTPTERIEAVDLISVRGAEVGNVVATMRELGCRHLLVVQTGLHVSDVPEVEVPPPPFAVREWTTDLPSTTIGERRWIRGLFSAAQLGRQLSMEVGDLMTPAASLAEVSRLIG
jgi:hypothetical protein